jgi:hypothetical protein
MKFEVEIPDERILQVLKDSARQSLAIKNEWGEKQLVGDLSNLVSDSVRSAWLAALDKIDLDEWIARLVKDRMGPALGLAVDQECDRLAKAAAKRAMAKVEKVA